MSQAQAAQTTEAEVLPPEQHPIAVYSPFRAQLAELVESNAKTVFDYETKEGDKAARSYIHKLKLTKGAIEAARKAEKAASLEYGRKVDAEAKELTSKLDEMIEVHQTQVLAIENREKERLAAIKAKIDSIVRYQTCAGHDSKECNKALENLQAIVIDESFAEFAEDAAKQKELAIAMQEKQLAAALKSEADAAELVRLREEKEAREKADREEAIRKEAAEKARKEAEAAAEKKAADEKAENERLAAEVAAAAQKKLDEERAKAEKAEADRLAAIAAAEKAEADLNAAKEKADREAKEAAERATKAEQDRVAAEAKKKADEDAAREADHAHRATVNAQAVTALLGIVVEDRAVEIIEVIAAGKVPNVKITY